MSFSIVLEFYIYLLFAILWFGKASKSLAKPRRRVFFRQRKNVGYHLSFVHFTYTYLNKIKQNVTELIQFRFQKQNTETTTRFPWREKT